MGLRTLLRPGQHSEFLDKSAPNHRLFIWIYYLTDNLGKV